MDWLLNMTDLPTWWAYVATLVIFVVLLILTWSKTRDSVLSDASDKAAWRDLRIWATALIAVQLMIYVVFN